MRRREAMPEELHQSDLVTGEGLGSAHWDAAWRAELGRPSGIFDRDGTPMTFAEAFSSAAFDVPTEGYHSCASGEEMIRSDAEYSKAKRDLELALARLEEERSYWLDEGMKG